MKRNIAALALVTTLLMSGCWPVMTVPPPPSVGHVVVCWLKNPGNAHDRQELLLVSKSFEGKIPGLINVAVGPVLRSTRPSVDSSFDVAIVMTFKDAYALDAYTKSPLHLHAVQNTLKPLVARYVVYDFVDEGKRGHQR
jgi:hypothetical protein